MKIKPNNILVIFISTYTDGVPPESAAWFYKCVTEMACDFRYQKDALKGLNYSICGLGNSLYDENFNKVAIELDKSISSLQANRFSPLYCCDENTVKSKHSSLEGDYSFWKNNFFEKLQHFKEDSSKPTSEGCCKSGETTDSCCKNEKAVEKTEIDDDEDEDQSQKYEDTTEEEDANGEGDENVSDLDEDLGENDGEESAKIMKQKNGLIDMEDLGTVMNQIKKEIR